MARPSTSTVSGTTSSTDRLWVGFHAGVILIGVALSVLALTL